MTAAALLAPHIATVLFLVYGFVILNFTAAGEEKRLSASTFGDEYLEFCAHVPRWIPRLKPRKGQANTASS